MSKKMWITLIAVASLLIIGLVVYWGGFERNDSQNWQFVQSPFGNIRIQNDSGWYFKKWAKVWTYPRVVGKQWNDIEDEGEKVQESERTTFNDGGTAQISTYVRYATPETDEERISFHRTFGGDIENATAAVKAHLIYCIKATGPLMSASEHQSARKAEFSQLVEGQLRNGPYQMKRVEKDIPIETDPMVETGVSSGEKSIPSPRTPKPKFEKKIVTELVLDGDGKPMIESPSPLDDYGITIRQFSITATDYDQDILKQFAAKKESFLAAEQSKADREKEKQERLNIIEKGLREVAEAQAAANVIKEKAVVEAQQKAEVATQAKVEAETKASMALEVARIAKEEAQVKLETAELDAQAIEVLATAEREKIRLAGALTELEQAQIDAKVQMVKDAAEGISKIRVPAVMFLGGNGATGTADDDVIMKNLINLKLLEGIGILDTANVNETPLKRAIDRTAADAPAP